MLLLRTTDVALWIGGDTPGAAERDLGAADPLTARWSLGHSWSIAAEVADKADHISFTLTVFREGTFVKGRPVAVYLDGVRTHVTTDELGEVVILAPSSLQLLRLEIEEGPSTELHYVALDRQHLTPVNLRRQPDGAIAFFRELGASIPFDGTPEGFETVLGQLEELPVEIERGQVMRGGDVLRGLRRLGVEIVEDRGKGSHQLAIRNGQRVPIPFRRGDIAKGTLNSILKKLNITFEELISA